MAADLNTFWFGLIALLWLGYFFLEGFDFGVGILLPALGRDNMDRRVMINTIGPVWDGNETWLIVAGGATFAAFPGWYATLFSGFYVPLFLILAGLIVRGVGLEWRAKHDSDRWRAWLDKGIFFGSLIPAVLWGVAFGSILRGVPIGPDQEFTGNLLDLLHPYALFGGVMTLLLFTLHGAIFLSLKTTGEMEERARKAARRLAWPTALVVFAFMAWTYDIVAHPAYTGGVPGLVVNAARPDNTGIVPGLVPLTAVGVLFVVGWLMRSRLSGWAFAATGTSILLIFATIFLSLYPRVLPSTLGQANDLTIYNTASSPYTLGLMSWVALFFTPVVLAYEAWSYWTFRRRISRVEPRPEATVARRRP